MSPDEKAALIHTLKLLLCTPSIVAACADKLHKACIAVGLQSCTHENQRYAIAADVFAYEYKNGSWRSNLPERNPDESAEDWLQKVFRHGCHEKIVTVQNFGYQQYPHTTYSSDTGEHTRKTLEKLGWITYEETQRYRVEREEPPTLMMKSRVVFDTKVVLTPVTTALSPLEYIYTGARRQERAPLQERQKPRPTSLSVHHNPHYFVRQASSRCEVGRPSSTQQNQDTAALQATLDAVVIPEGDLQPRKEATTETRRMVYQ